MVWPVSSLPGALRSRRPCDGQEALEKLSSFPAHVMLTDLSMPRMDGFELLRRLAVDGPRPSAIVLTAFGSIENALKTVRDLGAFWFLEKPIDANALRVLINRAAAQGRLTEETDRLQRQLSYQGLLEGLGRAVSSDARGLFGHPAGRA